MDITLYDDVFNTGLSADWKSTTGSTWTQGNYSVDFGFVNGTGSTEPVQLWLGDSELTFPDTSYVLGLVVCDSTSPEGGMEDPPPDVSEIRLGISIGNGADDTGGYDFVMYGGDNNLVKVIKDNAIVASASFSWSVGTDYWMKIHNDPIDGLAFKIWDATDPDALEPSTPIITLSDTVSTGFPGLVGGTNATIITKEFKIVNWDGADTTTFTPEVGSVPPLFINGTPNSVDSLPLVTLGEVDSYNASLPLFTKGQSTYNDGPNGLNLFLKQTSVFTHYTGGPRPSLYVRGTEGVELTNKSNPTPLFIHGFVYTSNHSMNLVIRNFVTPRALPLIIGGDFLPVNRVYNSNPLYTSGFFTNSGDTTLFIANYTRDIANAFNPLPLFVNGPTNIGSSGINLRPPLFIRGDVFKSYIKPLMYLYLWPGDRRHESIGLFLQTDPIPTLPFSTPLLIGGVGAGKQGNYRIVPLHIIGSTFYEVMGLVVHGKDEGGTSAIMRLTVKGGNNPVGGNVPLLVFNNNGGFNADAPLFVKGAGVNMGYFPFGGSMGLHVQRGPQNGITLFMCQLGSASSIPFHVIGAPVNTSSLLMFVDGFGGELTLTSPMFINGDVFTGMDNSCTLVMPKTVGFTPESAYLYTNGFNY